MLPGVSHCSMWYLKQCKSRSAPINAQMNAASGREPSVKKERRASDRRAGSQGPDGNSERTRLKKEEYDSDVSSDGGDSVAAPEPATVGCYEQLTRIMLTNMPSKVSIKITSKEQEQSASPMWRLF